MSVIKKKVRPISIEDAVKEIIEKESKTIKASIASTLISGSSTTTLEDARAIVASTAIEPKWPDPLDEKIRIIVREVVLNILEEERVLVAIGGKAGTYNKKSIVISKTDPDVSEVKILDKAEAFNIMEELEKIE